MHPLQAPQWRCTLYRTAVKTCTLQLAARVVMYARVVYAVQYFFYILFYVENFKQMHTGDEKQKCVT